MKSGIRKRIGFIKVLPLLAGLFGLNFTNAQTITGNVSTKGNSLPGATIKILNGNVSTVSDLTGGFTLQNNELGNLTLVVSYLGFTDTAIKVAVKAGLNNLGSIDLVAASKTLSDVIVRGTTALSQARAIAIKKNAPGIMEVLAADAIGKLPDRNATEAIQRIQGVSIARDAGEGRYFTVRGVPTQWVASLLNGNHLASASVDYLDRRIQMDIFPSELIQYVQMSKAITPDIEGDNIGGSVNFVTRTGVSKRTLSFNAAGGYNQLQQDGSYNASIVYGDRFLHNKLSFIVSAVIWDRPTRVNRYNVDYNISSPNPVQSFSFSDFQLRDYDMHRKTSGSNIGMEYAFNAKNKIFVRGLANQYDDNQMVREEYFNYNAGNAEVQTRHTINVTKLASIELGGTHTLSSKLKFDWAASIDKSSAESTNPSTHNPGYPIVNFVQKMKYNNLSSDGKMYLSMDSPNGLGGSIDHVMPNNATPLNADSLKLNQALVLRLKNSETNKRVAVNFNYTVNNHFSLKFGGKYQYKIKDVDNSPLDVYLGGILGPGAAMSSLQTEPYPVKGGFMRNLGSPYNVDLINQITSNQITSMVTPAGVTQYKLYGYEHDSATNATGASKYYHGDESVLAGYVMGEYKVNDKLDFIGGFRDENNQGNYYSSLVLTQSNPTRTTISPITEKLNYNVFLPMLHVKITPTNHDVIRLAYTEGYTRPDFGSLNPATVENDVSHTITQGNPSLQPAYSYNYDAVYEHYFGGIGLVNGGAFYKHIKDFIYNQGGSELINNISYLITQPENLPKAWLYGFEAGIQKRFSNLPGVLGGFGIDANYTFINSQTAIPRYVAATNSYAHDTTTLPQQSKNIFNVVLVYEKGGLSVRLAGNYKGQSVYTINAAYGPQHYVYAASNFTMDFSTSYAVSKQIRVFLEINNLLNTPTRYFLGTYNRVYQAEWYRLRGQVGVNVKLF